MLILLCKSSKFICILLQLEMSLQKKESLFLVQWIFPTLIILRQNKVLPENVSIWSRGCITKALRDILKISWGSLVTFFNMIYIFDLYKTFIPLTPETAHVNAVPFLTPGATWVSPHLFFHHLMILSVWMVF